MIFHPVLGDRLTVVSQCHESFCYWLLVKEQYYVTFEIKKIILKRTNRLCPTRDDVFPIANIELLGSNAIVYIYVRMLSIFF